jgi:hypothetical protein
MLGWLLLSIPSMCCATRRRCKPNARNALHNKPKKPSKRRKVQDATVSALADFHETQIFFSITLQVVCQVALSKAEKLEAKTAGELVANQFLIKAIGVAGIYPIVLNLCTMYRQKQFLDWFILSASLCCVVMAVATWSLAMSGPILPYQFLKDDSLTSQNCGPGNPMNFCISPVALHQVYEWLLKGRSLTVFDRVFLGAPAVAMSLVAFVALLVTRIEKFRGDCENSCKVNFFRWLLEKDQQDVPKDASPKDIQPSRLERAFYALVAVWEAWLFLSTLMLLTAISLLMVPVVRQQPKWSIGSIIAVAVWVPVTIKRLHTLWRKHSLSN